MEKPKPVAFFSDIAFRSTEAAHEAKAALEEAGYVVVFTRHEARPIMYPEASVMLRDQFAMAALTGLLVRGDLGWSEIIGDRPAHRDEIARKVAASVFAIADAMLNIRDAQG